MDIVSISASNARDLVSLAICNMNWEIQGLWYYVRMSRQCPLQRLLHKFLKHLEDGVQQIWSNHNNVIFEGCWYRMYFYLERECSKFSPPRRGLRDSYINKKFFIMNTWMWCFQHWVGTFLQSGLLLIYEPLRPRRGGVILGHSRSR